MKKKRSRSEIGRANRRDGKSAERAVVHLLHGRFRWEIKADRGLEWQTLIARTGRQHKGTPDSPDIITNIPATWFEVTRAAGMGIGTEALISKLIRAISDAGTENRAMVWWRRMGTAKDLWWVTTPAWADEAGFIWIPGPGQMEERAWFPLTIPYRRMLTLLGIRPIEEPAPAL